MHKSGYKLRSADLADREAIAELRAVVMRPDLERLGRFSEHRVRQRFKDAFEPQHTSIIEVEEAFAGSVAIRPADDGVWLEHFYLDPAHQGKGIGSAVLDDVLKNAEVVRLQVLQGSPARRLYERFGFVVYEEDPVDVYMVRERV